MKRSKASTVYEDRGKKRNKGEESENSSKSAKMCAKERTNSLRARKTLSIISNTRTIVTRSMAMKTMKQKDKEILIEVKVIQVKEEKKNDDIEPVELVQQQQRQQLVNEVVVVENKRDDGVLLTLEDWPLTWSYEEEWSWFKVGYECGWYSYWETMTGDFWAPMRNDNNEPIWNDDLWNFKDNSEIKKL